MKTMLTESVRPQGKRPLTEKPEKVFGDAEDLIDVEERLSIPKVVSMRNLKVVYRTPVSPTVLLGTWVNVDPTTRGLVKVVMRLVGSQLIVQPYGASHLAPVDWGSRAGTAYADNVGASQPSAFSATFPTSFKETLLTGRLQKSLLVVETLHRYTDDSGRSNQFLREIFRRA